MKADFDLEVFSRLVLCARSAVFNAPDNLGFFVTLPTSSCMDQPRGTRHAAPPVEGAFLSDISDRCTFFSA